ncbi:MAG: TlpA disulfide reductase family protein [Gammaproteobacteria bacterium]
MRARDGIIAVVLAAVLGTAAYLWFSPPRVRWAPDIRVHTTERHQLDLAALRGRPVLVTFWATTCPSCLEEIPGLSRLYRDLNPKGLEVIGVSMYYDPPNRVEQMISKRHIPYPVVNDINQRVARAFGMRRMVTPTSFLIAPSGRIVLHRVGLLDLHRLRSEIERMIEKRSS